MNTTHGPRRAPCALLLGALAACFVPGFASAQDDTSRQTANLAFAEQRPGVASALAFEIDYRNPDDPDGKPPAVSKVVTTLASGAQFDTSVPERCAATDAELIAQGEAACPTGSKVGGGSVRIDTGLAGPGRYLETDVSLLNAADQLILLFTDRASGAHVPVRAAVEGGTTTTNSPPLPGAPPDGGAVDVVDLGFDAISRSINGEQRAYVATPDSCPDSGAWVNTIDFTYSDGVSQTVPTSSPCTASAAPGTGDGGRCANRVPGTKRSDVLEGGTGSDGLAGRRGDDTLAGRAGDDCVRGGAGRDRIRGGAGADSIQAGRGKDRVRAGDGDDFIRLAGGGRDRVGCGPGDDLVVAHRRKDLVDRNCETVRLGRSGRDRSLRA